MARLKRDERPCPYCAEAIKSVAIRCRFCGSDVEPEPERDTEPRVGFGLGLRSRSSRDTAADAEDTAQEAEDAPAGDEEGSSRAGLLQRPDARRVDVRYLLRERLTLILAVLVVIAAVGVGTLWWRAHYGSPVAAPDGTVISEEVRTDVLVAAADLTQRTLSYDHRTFDNDMEVARARMTPEFRDEYDATMEQVRANTEANEIVLQAVVVSSAIIRMTEDEATMLVFVNQATSAGSEEARNEQLTRSSLVVTLVDDDGDWVMSELTSLG